MKELLLGKFTDKLNDGRRVINIKLGCLPVIAVIAVIAWAVWR